MTAFIKSITSYLSVLLGSAALGCTEEAGMPEVPSVDALPGTVGGADVNVILEGGFGVRDRDNTWFCGREPPACARS